jgi:Ca2+-binding RTX toxin-like protein
MNSMIYWDGTATKPISFNFSAVQPEVVRNRAYVGNLSAVAGANLTLTYDQLLNDGITSQPPGFTVDPTSGGLSIPAANTTTYLDNTNTLSTGGDYAFSGNIYAKNASGLTVGSVEFDWLFDAVNVGSVNLAPAVDDVTTSANVGVIINHTFTGSDQDGDAISWANVGLIGPGGATPAIAPTFNPATQAFSWNTAGSVGGTWIAQVKATDPFGSTDIGSLTINLSSAPDLLASSDTGYSGTDNVTSDNTPTFEGVAGANNTVRVFAGSTLLGTTTANGLGQWSFTAGTMADGNYGITAQASDGVNTNTSAALALQIDTQAPTISHTRTAANANGWNNADVTVSFTGADGLSGVHSVTADTTFTAEGANQSVTGSVTDKAGNTTTPLTVGNINIDKTAPTASAAATFGPAATGWYNIGTGAPVIHFTASDGGGSGLAGSVPADVTLGEGAGVGTSATISDLAGNSVTVGVSGLKVDLTAPVISGAPDRAANAAGWYNADVTVSFSTDDALSGLRAVPMSVPLGEGANQSVTGTVTDAAGNSASATVGPINIDKTAPVITAARRAGSEANANGWNKVDVTVVFTASDALSSVAAPANQVFGEGAGQTASATVTDLAGNAATATLGDINVDKTAPVLTAAVDKLPAATGWYNIATGAPTFTYSASDALSAGVSPPAAATPGNGANQDLRRTVTDLAGNSATVSTAAHSGGTTVGLVDVDIDLVAPVISAQRDTAANAHGWNNTDVSSSYLASDVLSGLASAATGTYTFTAEGADQSHTFTVADVAGNSSSTAVTGVNIDKTAPNISYTRTAANAHGWNNADVVVDFSGSDGLSGVDAVVGDQTLTAEGANQAVTGTVTDKAGNSVSTTVTGIKIDKTAPTVQIDGYTTAVPGELVTLTSAASVDGLSGLDETTRSWQPGGGSGVTYTFTPTATNAYTVTVSVKDKAGNESSDSHVVTVSTAIVRDGDLLVGGTSANDHIIFTPASGGQVTAKLNGVVLGTFAPTGRLLAYGQGGNDDIQVSGSLALSAWLDGGEGDDRLSGGAGNDVVLGGAGADLVIGGQGRDLLIGGAGADRIIGNADDDVLISGFTAHDTSHTALAAIMGEWTSGRTFAERVAALETGVGAGNAYRLKATGTDATVSDDGAQDVMTGGAGSDWFLFNADGSAKDTVTDLSTFESLHADDIAFMNIVV